MAQRRPLVIIDVQEGDAHQHEDATKQGIEHEFQCCVVPLRSSTPELDQKITGDEHEFPKHEEEDQVDGEEDPHSGRFKGEERHHVEFHLMADGVPGIDDD